MKIALLHLDLSAGPAEKNIEQLLDGIKIAAANGAQWVITPEMAVQGYFFTQMNSPVNLKMKIENIIQPITTLAQKLGIHIFLGCGEYEEKSDNNYVAHLSVDGVEIGVINVVDNVYDFVELDTFITYATVESRSE